MKLARIVLLLLVLAPIRTRAAELELEVISGNPNPTLTLDPTALAEVDRLLAEAKPGPAQDPALTFPAQGYRSLLIRGWPTNGPGGSIRLSGKHALLTSGANRIWFRLQDTRLERLLVDLAAAKGALDDESHRGIRRAIDKRSPNTLFLDDFDRPLDPVWSGALPSTSNSWPDFQISFAGPSGHLPDRDGSSSLLQVTNTLARGQRRGWSTATNFFSTAFRCEIRFRLLRRLANGGFIELWLLDPRNPERFVFASLFGGLSSASVVFTWASSVSGESLRGPGWFDERFDVYYRMAIEAPDSENMRSALLTDSGEEIFSHVFQHTANAFLGGFKIGISQSGNPLGGSTAYPTQVAVDSIHLTGPDTLIADRRLSRYDFAEWGGQTSARYEHPAARWTPDFTALGLTNALLRAEGVWTNSQKAGNYIFEDPEFPGIPLRLRTWEGSNVISAQLAMMDQLGIIGEMEPEPLPPGSMLGMNVGDRAYAGWGAADPLCFVRNNVFVFLSGGPSIRRVAEKLDNDLVLRSFAGPVLLKPELTGGIFHFRVPTLPSRTYCLESSDTPDGSNWTAHPQFPGDGTIRPVALPARSPRQFVRLRATPVEESRSDPTDP